MAYGGLQGQAPQGVAPINGLPTNDVRELTVRSGNNISAGDVVDVEGGEVFKTAITEPIATNNNIYSNVIGTIPPIYMLYYATSKEGYLTLTLSDVITYKDVNTIDIPSRNLSYSVEFNGSVKLSDNSFIIVFGNRGWKEFYKITIEQNTIKYTKIGEKEFTTFSDSIFLKLNDSKILVSGRYSGSGEDIYVELDISTKTFKELSYNSMYVEGISPTPLGNNLFIIGSKDLGDYQDFRLFKYTGTAFNQIAKNGLDRYSTPIASIPFGSNKIVCLFKNGSMSVPAVRTYLYSSSALTPIATKILNTGDTPTGSYGHSTPNFVKVGNQIVVALAEPKAKKTFIEILEISEDGKTITENYRTVVSNEQQGSNLYSFGNTSNIFWQSTYSSSQSTKAANIILYNNQFVGEVLDSSKTAIALQSASSGQQIPVGFGGYCECDGVTERQTITSGGVMGYGIQDGWLDIRPSYSKDYVVGSFKGKGGVRSNTIDFGFSPSYAILYTNDTYDPSFILQGRTYSSRRSIDLRISWTQTGITIQANSSNPDIVFDDENETYYYIAFR